MELREYMPSGPEKVSRKLLSVSSPNIDRFSTFFTDKFCRKLVIGA